MLYRGLLCLLFLLPSWGLAHAGETRSINFAAFQKLDKSFEFEPIVVGKFSDFIVAMQGSQVLVLAHTSSAVDGDVITLQTSVLRDEEGAFGDFGIDCQMSFKDESTATDTSFLIGGLCKIIRKGRGQNLKLLAPIPHTFIPDTAQGSESWIMLYEDTKTGIAFYANVSAAK